LGVPPDFEQLMFQRSRIVWKLSAVFITIILFVFLVSGHLNNLVDEHYALASAQDLCRFNSATMRQSIKASMMTRDRESIERILKELARDNPVYGEMRLVSHNGTIAASRHGSLEERLPLESRPCQMCHRYEPPLEGSALPHHDEIVRQSDGTRVVSVVTPFLHEPSCGTAGCHAAAKPGQVLGFLQTDYSLSGVDAITSVRSFQTAVAALIAVALGTLGTWLMVGRILKRPILELATGMERISRGELDYRVPVHREDEFTAIAESFNDMTTKLELLLQRLRETRDHLEGIVESSADIIITVNTAGFIQTFNTGAELALGYSRDEMIDQRVEKLFADTKEREAVAARLDDSDNVANYETTFLTKDGDVRNVIFSVSRLRGPYGFPIGTFAIGKDITHEKKLQRQLVQSERYAAIGQSFTAIQHAMKNMLNALTGGSYMVKVGINKKNWEMLADGWEMVSEGIANIKDMSKNLLMYVKDWEPEFESVSVGAIIKKIDNVFAKTAADNGAAFKTRVPPDLPEARCDASLIHSAIMDIVSNALEACLSKEYEDGDSARIDLTATHDAVSEKIAIEIRDNGPGMTESVKAHIFTPFFSTKKKKGTGLGLALTSRIVTLHKGAIDVASEPGRGSVFHILLPVAGPEASKENRDGEESTGHR
jgi:two-component system NtrC family sensor kinase